MVDDPAARFENLVACHLLKWCHFQQDTEVRNVELRYFRDAERREVDFVIMEDNKPLQFIECKTSRHSLHHALYKAKGEAKDRA